MQRSNPLPVAVADHHDFGLQLAPIKKLPGAKRFPLIGVALERGKCLALVFHQGVVSLNVVYEPSLVTGHAGGVGPAVMPAQPVN